MSSHDDDPSPEREADILYVHGPNEAGDGARVLRQRGSRIELGEMRPSKEGQPLSGELVRLRPRPESERLFDVEVLYTARSQPDRMCGGPARVATARYRAGWEVIFGRDVAGDGEPDDEPEPAAAGRRQDAPDRGGLN